MDDGAGNAAKSPNDMLGLGIARLGVTSTMVLPGVAKFPHTRIVAAADFRPNALDAFKRTYGGDCYETVEALCADPNVELVWIGTPNQFH